MRNQTFFHVYLSHEILSWLLPLSKYLNKNAFPLSHRFLWPRNWIDQAKSNLKKLQLTTIMATIPVTFENFIKTFQETLTFYSTEMSFYFTVDVFLLLTFTKYTRVFFQDQTLILYSIVIAGTTIILNIERLVTT